jgi:hypothetical protein
MALTAIPAQFGAGGVGMQGTRYGTPSLRALLEEHRAAIATLQAADGMTIARIATTADHGLSGLAAIDGKTPIAGNTILVKSQTAPAENGLYVAASGAWSRLTDATGADVIAAGMIVQVLEGTANGDKQFFLSTDNPIVVDTTALTFTLIPNLADLASTANGKGASLIGLEDAAGLLAAADVEAGIAENATNTVTANPGIPMQNRLRLLGAPGAAVAGDTVVIGADTYEFRGDTPPTGGTAGRVWVYNGADSAASRANLINAINGVVDAPTIGGPVVATETMLAAAGITTGDIIVASADAVGGSKAPSAVATATTEGLTTATDIWDHTTMQYGAAQAASQKAAITVTLGAEELAKGTMDIVFDFTPTSVVIVNRSRPQNEVFTITGGVVSLTLAGGASPNNQSGDVLDIVAFG